MSNEAPRPDKKPRPTKRKAAPGAAERRPEQRAAGGSDDVRPETAHEPAPYAEREHAQRTDIHRKPHALPPKVLGSTFAALVVLTVVTVAVSRVDLGPMNVVIALAIATLKATVVAAFFMHLKYENRFLTLILGTAVFFAVFLVGFVSFDTVQYQPDVRAKREADAARAARAAPPPQGATVPTARAR